MGLHLCYELRLPGTASGETVHALLTRLHERARGLSFDRLSAVLRLDGEELTTHRPRGALAFERMEDFVHFSAGVKLDGCREDTGAPSDAPAEAVGFGVVPGRYCEGATFGLLRVSEPEGAPRDWWWHHCCKTQYASVVGGEHLVRCHTGLVALLDEAARLGVGVVVRDETGYWDSRDAAGLIAAVHEMNRIVARLAGRFHDAVRDSRSGGRAEGAIFAHPDFERLETDQ